VYFKEVEIVSAGEDGPVAGVARGEKQAFFPTSNTV
jgi:hypothetical protein